MVELDESASGGGHIGVIGRWRAISRLARVLADTSMADERSFARLIFGLTAPVRWLDELAQLADRALEGDTHARCELRTALAALQAAATASGASTQDIAAIDEHLRWVCEGDQADDPRAPEDADEVLDQRAAGALLLAVDAEYRDDGEPAHDLAMDAVVSLVLATGLIGGLSTALARGGRDELVARLRSQGELGRLSWVPAAMPMSVRSGQLQQMPALPGVPRLPDVPDVPGLPEFPGIPQPELDTVIEQLLGRLRKWRVWDPEDWDRVHPWWKGIFGYIDAWELSPMRCFLELRRLLAERSRIFRPISTRRVTWNDGISGITQSGACTGDRVTIHGVGFGATQPPDVVLLVPQELGCRPHSPDSWSDTTITFTLPAGVTSGPIGFGDAGFIARYDGWVAQMNASADEIRRLPCGRAIRVPETSPFHMCPPESPLTQLQAGSPAVSAFTANWDSLAVVEPGDPITLRWTVSNAPQVRVDRISADGPWFGGSSALVNPSAASYTLSAPSSGRRETYRYRLTADGPCGRATREVTVVSIRRPRLRIASTEVTQSIQTTVPSVRLVERKPTIVRVTVRHGLGGWGSNNVPGVRGRMRVRRGPQVSPWYDAANGSSPMAPTAGASITVQANPQRSLTDDTLNFLVPPAWCTESARFQIEVRVVGFGSGDGFTGFDEMISTTTGSLLFEPRRTLELRYIRVNWGGSTPSDATCVSTLRNAVPLLPTPTANVFPLSGVAVQNPSGTGDGDRDGLIDDFDDRHNCSTWEALTEWLGSDCPDEDGTFWVLIPGVFFRGRAKDIPSNVCFTPPADGPYAAHELAHCLNQTHVGLMCANGQQAQGGDPSSAWANNAALVDVPFDVTRNVALSLAGTGVFDLMTYCGTPNNTWPMPARWQRLWDRIGG